MEDIEIVNKLSVNFPVQPFATEKWAYHKFLHNDCLVSFSVFEETIS
jgi:hypothetical protein